MLDIIASFVLSQTNIIKMKGTEEASEKMFHIVISSKDEVLCRDFKDYTTLENYICFAAYRNGNTLLAYAVMSNHIHIAIVSTEPTSFIRTLQLSYAMYFNRRYERRGTVCGKHIYCKEVRGYPQQKTVISYILRNPMHHGICETPWQYCHSSISVYFLNSLSAIERPSDEDCSKSTNSKRKDILLRCGTSRVRFPIDKNGRILLRKCINAGRVEHIFRTARSFIHCMNRWNTEDWEKEQTRLFPEGGVFSLENVEPDNITPVNTMRAYEQASFRPCTPDIDICRHIDQTLLPHLGLASYTHMNGRQKSEAALALQRKYRISPEQAYRCLGGPV